MQEQEEVAVQPGRVRGALTARTGVAFVVMLGIVSLFADTTYEGARSINGQYLLALGASGTAVGFIGGFGELMNYGLRLVSGYLSDRTGRYWTVALSGYVINLLAVPALALAGSWQLAGALMIAERMGKGFRNPPRDAMLSHASTEMGRGWGFGLHEAMDQTGAVLGPLIVTAVIYFRGGYEPAYGLLFIPALCALFALSVANRLFPNPRDFEPIAKPLATSGFPRPFWIYMAAAALIAAGFADFTLIAFRLEDDAVVRQSLIPVFYAVAMLAAGAGGVVSGRLFDRIGLWSLIGGVIVSAAFAPLAFLGNGSLALLGIVVWAVGIGAHDTVLGAAIAEMVVATRRATAYGVYNAGFGVAWFIGSLTLGILYDVSIAGLVAFAIATQLAAIPLLLLTIRADGGLGTRSGQVPAP
jgi:MFS family permease